MPLVSRETGRGAGFSGPRIVNGLATFLVGFSLALFAISSAEHLLVELGPATERTVAALIGVLAGAVVVCRTLDRGRWSVADRGALPVYSLAALLLPSVITALADWLPEVTNLSRGTVGNLLPPFLTATVVIGPVAGLALHAISQLAPGRGSAGLLGVASATALTPFLVAATLGPGGAIAGAGVVALVAWAAVLAGDVGQPTARRPGRSARPTARVDACVAAAGLGLACGPWIAAYDVRLGGTEVASVFLPALLLFAVASGHLFRRGAGRDRITSLFALVFAIPASILLVNAWESFEPSGIETDLVAALSWGSTGRLLGAVFLFSAFLPVVFARRSDHAEPWGPLVWAIGVAAAAFGRVLPHDPRYAEAVMMVGVSITVLAAAASQRGRGARTMLRRALTAGVPLAVIAALATRTPAAARPEVSFESDGAAATPTRLDGEPVSAFEMSAAPLRRLVGAALALAPRPRRTHVLGAGGAPIVRALLDHDGMAVTWVTPIRAELTSARRLIARSDVADRVTPIHASARAWLAGDGPAIDLVFVIDRGVPVRHAGRLQTRQFEQALSRRLSPGGIVSRPLSLSTIDPDDLFTRQLPRLGSTSLEVCVLIDHPQSASPAIQILSAAGPIGFDLDRITARLAEMGDGARPLVDAGIDARGLLQLVVLDRRAIAITRHPGPRSEDAFPADAAARPARPVPNAAFAAESFARLALGRTAITTRARAADFDSRRLDRDHEAIGALLGATAGALRRGAVVATPTRGPFDLDAARAAWLVLNRSVSLHLGRRVIESMIEDELRAGRKVVAARMLERLVRLEVGELDPGAVTDGVLERIGRLLSLSGILPSLDDVESRAVSLRALLLFRPDHPAACLESGLHAAGSGRGHSDEAARLLETALSGDVLTAGDRARAELVIAWLERDRERVERWWPEVPVARRDEPLNRAIRVWSTR